MRTTIFLITLVTLSGCSGLLALKDSGDGSPDATAADAATDSPETPPVDAAADADVSPFDADTVADAGASDGGGCNILLAQARLNLVRGSRGRSE